MYFIHEPEIATCEVSSMWRSVTDCK